MFALIVSPISHAKEKPGAERPVTPDDFLRQVAFTQFGWSPDGKAILYTLSNPNKRAYRIAAGTGTDVWVAGTSDAQPKRISDGQSEVSYWSPSWSPDGENVAFLATRGAKISLLVWDRKSDRTREVTGGLTIDPGSGPPFVWLTSERIACLTRSVDDPPSLGIEPGSDTILRATQRWQKASENESASVAVSVSPMSDAAPEDLKLNNVTEQSKLTIIDVLSKARIEVGDAYEFSPALSPDKKYLAFFDLSTSGHPQFDVNSAQGVGRQANLVVVDAEGREVSRMRDSVVPMRAPLWSPDGRRVAFLAAKSVEHEETVQVFMVDRLSGTSVVASDFPGRRFADVDWSSSRLLGLSLPEASVGGDLKYEKDARWTVIGEGGASSALNGISVLGTLQFLGAIGPDKLLAFADQRLWVIDGRASSIEPFEIEGIDRASDVMMPQCGTLACPNSVDILIRPADDESRWLDLNILTHRTKPAELPISGGVEIGSYSSVGALLLVERSKMGRASEWLEDAKTGRTWPLSVEANAFLDDIKLGAVRMFSYRDLDGVNRGARLTLPPNYKTGNKYPMVVIVYPGTVFRPSDTSVEDRMSDNPMLDPQLFASKGYLVLQPSMALPNENGEFPKGHDELYAHLLSGLLPAVDRAIELGYADRDRLALMGHSFGGSAVYALITETDRFKAAISMSGPADLISMYGTFWPEERYGAVGAGVQFRYHWSEVGQADLGGEPWNRGEQYLRNSPPIFADRIHTPLLIIHGDLDSVPVEQAEEMFSALLRQGKKCRFVRYYGQSHIFDNPSSIRNEWKEIYDWLDAAFWDGAERTETGISNW
jgi:dipeptidyl aminopeptidase/acylaminoacyl peptidase